MRLGSVSVRKNGSTWKTGETRRTTITYRSVSSIALFLFNIIAVRWTPKKHFTWKDTRSHCTTSQEYWFRFGQAGQTSDLVVYYDSQHLRVTTASSTFKFYNFLRIFFEFFGCRLPVSMLIDHVICSWAKYSWADYMVQVAKNEMWASVIIGTRPIGDSTW